MPEFFLKVFLLSQKPLESTYLDVAKFTKDKGWYDYHHVDDFGYWDQEKNTITGVKSIMASLGTYYNFFKIYVTAYWAFNENDRLINVWIEKSVDAF